MIRIKLKSLINFELPAASREAPGRLPGVSWGLSWGSPGRPSVGPPRRPPGSPHGRPPRRPPGEPPGDAWEPPRRLPGGCRQLEINQGFKLNPNQKAHLGGLPAGLQEIHPGGAQRAPRQIPGDSPDTPWSSRESFLHRDLSLIVITRHPGGLPGGLPGDLPESVPGGSREGIRETSRGLPGASREGSRRRPFTQRFKLNSTKLTPRRPLPGGLQ